MRHQILLSGNGLRRPEGFRLDPASLRWHAEPDAAPDTTRRVSPLEAASWLLRRGGGRRLPVSILGPREPTPGVLDAAEAVSRLLAGAGFPLICGGRGGAMEAASRGCEAVGGLMIGLLASEDWREANPHVSVPLATGLGEARNAVIASAGFALVACGGRDEPVSYGTISEMALGLRHGCLVIGLPEAPDLTGVVRCATAEEAAARVAVRYLGLD